MLDSVSKKINVQNDNIWFGSKLCFFGKLAGLMFVFMLGTSNAQAIVLIEPTVGYTSTTFQEVTSSATTKMTLGGPQYGLQLQWLVSSLLLGVEGQTYSGKLKTSDSLTTSDLKVTDTYAQLGFFSNRFRMWASYGLSNEFKKGSSATYSKYSGTTIKGSMTYLITNHFSVGLQYVVRNFSKATDQAGVETKIGTGQTNKEVTSKEMGVLVSFPF